MARPLKEGLSYFSHDVDMSADPKIEAIESLHGILGYAYYNKLLEKIYRSADGCIEAKTELHLRILASGLKLSVEEFIKYMNDAIEVGLFDRKAFQNDHIITSNGIRKRRGAVVDDRERARQWNKDHRNGKPETPKGKTPQKYTKPDELRNK